MKLTREALIAIDVAIIAARHARDLARLAHNEDANDLGDVGAGIDLDAAPIPELVALASQPTTQFMLQPPSR